MVRNPGSDKTRDNMSNAHVDVKYLCKPHDGTPGDAWDTFEEDIMNVAAGKVDASRPSRGRLLVPGDLPHSSESLFLLHRFAHAR